MASSALPDTPRLSLPADLTEQEVRALLTHLKAIRPDFVIAFWSRIDIEPWLTVNRGLRPGEPGYRLLSPQDWQRLRTAPHWGDLDVIVYEIVEHTRMLPRALAEAGFDSADPVPPSQTQAPHAGATPPSAPADAWILDSYADVFKVLRGCGLDALPARSGAGHAAIHVRLPGDRWIDITAHDGTLPQDRAALSGWLVTAHLPGGGTSGPRVVYVSRDPSTQPMAAAVLTHAATISVALAQAQERVSRGQLRRCPYCNHDRDDARLPDEPCADCQ